MRSWTTFLVFAGIIVALVLLFAVNRISNTRHPVTIASMDFLDAVTSSQLSKVTALLDPKSASTTTAGPELASVRFKECTVGDTGAFGHLPAIIWSTMEIKSLVIDETRTPTVTDDGTSSGAGLATVLCKNGSKILLRRTSGDAPWRIFYLAKPDDKDKP